MREAENSRENHPFMSKMAESLQTVYEAKLLQNTSAGSFKSNARTLGKAETNRQGLQSSSLGTQKTIVNPKVASK